MVTLSTLFEATGWIGLLLNIWGNWELTNVSARGWVIRLLCNAFYIVYCLHTGAWALLANHVVFAAINVRGWLKWTRQNGYARARLGIAT